MVLMMDQQNLCDEMLTLVRLEHLWGEGKVENGKDGAGNASLMNGTRGAEGP